MDFNEFGKYLNEEYGVDENDLSRYKKSIIVSFETRDDGKVFAKYRGKTVYRHRDYENEINSGETWICSIDTGYEDNWSFAKPIMKIDSSFMYELKKDQIDEIATVVWEKQKQSILPFLEEKYHDINEATVAQLMKTQKEQYDAEIARLKNKITTLELENKTAQDIIEEMENIHATEIEKLASTPLKQKADPDAKEKIKTFDKGPEPNNIQSSKDEKIFARRTGTNAIESNYFTKMRYYVHFSPDYSVLSIQAHNHGNVYCKDQKIELAGLDVISNYIENTDLTFDINQYEHEMIIYL